MSRGFSCTTEAPSESDELQDFYCAWNAGRPGVGLAARRRETGGEDWTPRLSFDELLDYCFGAVFSDWSGAGCEVAFRRPR